MDGVKSEREKDHSGPGDGDLASSHDTEQQNSATTVSDTRMFEQPLDSPSIQVSSKFSWKMISSTKIHAGSKFRTAYGAKVHKRWVYHNEFIQSTRRQRHPNVYQALRPVVVVATFLGMMPVSNATSTQIESLAFYWLSPQTAFTLFLLAMLTFTSWMTAYFYIVTPAEEWSIESVAVRPRETVFYISATVFLLFSIRTSRRLSKLLLDWDKAANQLKKYLNESDPGKQCQLHLRVSRTLLLTVYFMASAITEHVLHDVVIAHKFCGNGTAFFECYYVYGNEYFSHSFAYSWPLAITVFVLNKFATLAWNYQDLFIALVSCALCTNFSIINRHLKKSHREFHTSEEWKTIREDHMALCDVVRKIDNALSPAVLLSYAVNIYFLCIQIFYAIRPSKRSFMETAYFCSSFYHLFVRLCVVSFSAASFYDQALEPLRYLQRCPTSSYCEEVTRFISHLSSSSPCFTGYKFFPVNRSFFLAIVSVVLTYELILLNVK